MIKLQREGKLYQWMKVNIRYLKNIFSIENPVSYVLHLDEVTDDERTFFRITIPCHEAAGNIIADIAHKDGSLKASKRGVLKTGLQSGLESRLQSALQSAPETALQIINEIRNNPNVTLSEIAEKIGVSRR